MSIPFPDGNYMFGTSTGELMYHLSICRGEMTKFSGHETYRMSVLFTLTSGETSMVARERKYLLVRTN
jgi:hypothetical protein